MSSIKIHPTKNTGLDIDKLAKWSKEKVWFVCAKCNHEWLGRYDRLASGYHCPKCSKAEATKKTWATRHVKLLSHSSIAKARPDLEAEWHGDKNASTPDAVYIQSGEKRWWKCNSGHEYQCSPYNRNKGRGCPYCKNKKVWDGNCFATACPEEAKSWHPTKNGDLTPRDVTLGSKKIIWWSCEQGHEWQAPCYTRKKGVGCPFCVGQRVSDDNHLLAKLPELAKEWHPTKNGDLTPDKVIGGNRKRWWMCDKGHEWQASIKHRRHGTGCPHCNAGRLHEDNSLQVLMPELANEWHPTKNGDLTPDQCTLSGHRQIWWLCSKCGHEWKCYTVNRTKHESGCPKCGGSRQQKLLFALVRELYPEHKDTIEYDYWHSDLRFKKSGKKMQLDVFVPALNLAFEYQGGGHYGLIKRWKKDFSSIVARDAEKRTACSDKGIKLVLVDYRWDGKKETLEKYINGEIKPLIAKEHKVKEGVVCDPRLLAMGATISAKVWSIGEAC